MIKIGILGDIGSGKSYVATKLWLSSFQCRL
jgi:dephospho-CoA kinase